MKCKNCNTENPADAKFCRQCGEPLSSSPWWIQYNLAPMTMSKLKPSFINWVVLIFLYILSLTALSVSIGLLIWCIEEKYKDHLTENIFLIIFCILFIAFVFLTIKFQKRYFHRERIRKKRGELKDTDFIEAKKRKYSIVARGDATNHKFGLFDTKNVKLTVSYVFDELKWSVKNKLLQATFTGQSFSIDVNGNIYK